MDLYYNIIACIWAFLIAVFAIPAIIDVAHVKKILDIPNTRTVHESLTPRLGGVAIFAGLVSAVTIFGQISYMLQLLLAGSILIFFIGLTDDLVSVSAIKKILVQLLAASIMIFMADVRVTDLHGLFGIYQVSPFLSYLITYMIIIGITNAINLIDGLDGLAGTIICMIALFFAFCFLFGDGPSDLIMIMVCLFGAVAGFLRFNINKAIIFMGDTGSLVCGFIVSVVGIQFVELDLVPNSAAYAVGILFLPILDTTRVFLMRIASGVSPFSPDKNHIHHRLTCLGMSHLQAVTFLISLNIGALSVVFFCNFLGSNILLILLVLYGMIFSFILEFLYKRKVKLADAL